MGVDTTETKGEIGLPLTVVGLFVAAAAGGFLLIAWEDVRPRNRLRDVSRSYISSSASDNSSSRIALVLLGSRDLGERSTFSMTK